jgi:GT2 family glycosyltransferase
MAVHNGAPWLKDVLDSIVAQSYPPDAIEIRIIDNASTDSSAHLIRTILSPLRLSLISSDENIGFWSAMEKLIAGSDAPYVICLTDVVLHPDFIAQAVTAMETDPAIGAIQGKIYEQHRADDDSWVRTDRIDALGFRLGRSRRVTILGHGERDTGQFNQPIDIVAVEGAVPVFRRRAIDDCRIDGHFADTDFRIGSISYGDDVDMGWRMTLFGWRQVMIPTAIGWHDRSTTKGTAKIPVIGHLERLSRRKALPIAKRRADWSNVRFSIIKNDYIINILRDLPHILVREAAVLCYTLMFEPAVFAEAIRFIRLAPKMFRRRRQVIARAVASPSTFRAFIT